MLNIVIPMAGSGSRFAKAGYAPPKPLIPIHSTPMIQAVINNLRPEQAHRFIFICQKAHVAAHGLRNKLAEWAPGSVLVEIDGLSQGAACTVLAAKTLINNDQPLMIANSDQYVDIDINTYLACSDRAELDGLIMTMFADDPKWSFVALDHNGHVTRVVEKEVISHEATVGIYNFRQGRHFVEAAEAMMAKSEQVNGEYYVAPAYNQLIAAGYRIGIYNIGDIGTGMHGLGTPEDLEAFLARPLSHRLIPGQT